MYNHHNCKLEKGLLTLASNQKPFIDWVKRELTRRDWSIRYLASLTSYSHSHLSNVLNGEKKATFELCYQVAQAMDHPVWKTFLMAGLLEPPDDVTLDEESSLIVDIYKQLDERHRKEIYEYVKWYGERHQN